MKIFIKIYKLSLAFIIFVLLSPFSQVYSSSNAEKSYNILIINSYNLKSDWENLIYKGFKDKLSLYDNVNIHLEFLDSKTQNTPEYISTFTELLNMKYSKENIDVIVTIDDEAFNLVKNNIFNENTIFYRKPVVFIGVNSNVSLSIEESMYMTGVVEMEDNLRFLNMIIDIDNTIENVIFILDNSIFSNIVKESVISTQYLTKKNLYVSFIQSDIIEEILPKISTINDRKTALILVGDFYSSDGSKIYSLKDNFKLIKEKTKIPIYTKIQPYIYAGAIGGVVDWGQYHGEVAGEFIIRLLSGDNVSNLTMVNNSLDVTVFNYDAITNYNINPLTLPKDSIFINKGPFDFLLPLPLKILVWTFVILSLLGIMLIIFMHINKSRNEKLRLLLYNKALEQEKFKNDFITTMSHEFRTPINIILSTTQLLNLKSQTSVIDSKYLQSKLNYITLNSNRLLRIINNIIDITKLESGFVKPNFIYDNIVEVIENTVLSTVDYAEAHGIEITFDTVEEEILTAFDKIKIERCMLNLISNAIKFTPPQGKIFININQKDNSIIIEVIDSGIGIPESEVLHIFDRFHQVNTSLTRSTEGSGLGLFIVNELIKLHGGSIVVESKLNQGSKFIITIPIIKNTNMNINTSFTSNDLSELVKLEFSDLNKKGH